MLSRRIEAVAPSMTLAITSKFKAMKAAGEDVIGFGAGEPDFDTPEVIKAAARDAIDQGKTKYTPVDGVPELKTAIAERFQTDHDLAYTAEEIAVTAGGKQALFNLILSAVNPGDGVLIPSPYWVSYPDQVRLADGEVQVVPTHVEHDFKLMPEALEAAIQPNSKILILNSPSNPTGSALSRSELEGLAEVILRHDLWVISDEIYEKLVYDDFAQTSIATISEKMKERTVVVNGVSKAYSMTGWRIGYMAGPAHWVRAAVKLQGQSTSNPASISQWAALAALKMDLADIDHMRTAFASRRDMIVQLLNDIDGVTCPSPQGAFYVFPDVREAIAGRFDSTLDFAQALLEEVGVAVVPGEGFGAPGCVRLSYATSDDDIRNGLSRIAGFLAG